MHFIWCNPFFIKRVNISKCIYIDDTLNTYEYYQLSILLFFDENTNKNIPGVYILIITRHTCFRLYLYRKPKKKLFLSQENNYYYLYKNIIINLDEHIDSKDLLFNPYTKYGMTFRRKYYLIESNYIYMKYLI